MLLNSDANGIVHTCGLLLGMGTGCFGGSTVSTD